MTRARRLTILVLLAAALAIFVGAPLLLLAARADDPYADLPVDPADRDPPKALPPAPHTVAAPPPAPAPPRPTAPLPPSDPPPSFFGRDIHSASGTLVYVIDISGSMDGLVDATRTRLDVARTELARSIAGLPTAFRFNVVAYDCGVRECFDGGGTGQFALEPADRAHVGTAVAWAGALRAGGATGTGPAVVEALRARSNLLLVLLTDGDPNCGAGNELGDASCRAAHLSQIRFGNAQGARIDVFGIAATGDFRGFCLDVARLNHGTYTDVR